LTRQILTVSGKKKINLSTEIEILTKYLELEKMRFAEGFEYTLILGDNIDEDYHQIPPMLIQPFVENSIKHGLLHKQGDKKLSISFDLDEDEENLICVVEDNGVGREKSAEFKSKRVQQHESFSTSATEERLKLLGNGIANKNFVVYEDLQNDNNEVVGTKVTLTITLG
jgi:LytS/YehU family sensor histidine kinase